MVPHHLHLLWIKFFWCLLFSSNGSKVTCVSDFYTLLLNNCQQSTVVTKGTVKQHLNEERRAAPLTLSRVSRQSRGCWTSAHWRGTPSWVDNTPGSRWARHMTGQPHSCSPAEATTKATGLSLQTAPESKGNPNKTHSSFHSSLTQDYVAAPYPRWAWVLAAKWTAGGWAISGHDTSHLKSTCCSFFWWCWRYHCQQWHPIKFWHSYFLFTRLT